VLSGPHHRRVDDRERPSVPSYLADVFSKPDGWIKALEADPDADAKPGAQSVYAIDCEMVGVKSGYIRTLCFDDAAILYLFGSGLMNGAHIQYKVV
jgi:hypothetical protein